MALFYELKKPLNIYFIVIAILSYLPKSPKEPVFNTITVLCYLALITTKNILSDQERQRFGKSANNFESFYYDYVFMSHFLKCVKDIKVGDFITIKQDGFVPADILLIDANTISG